MRVCITTANFWLLGLLIVATPTLVTAQEKGQETEAAEAEPMPVPNVERPATPATPPDSAELNVRPDAEGFVSFSFRGQPWPAVLEWLADVSDKSLEWQEAPPGFLDLTTRGKYTVPEVRDLINSVLLSRGFTLLDNREMLLVMKLDQLDISLIPRVTPEELDARGKHELVRTSFDLERLRADKFVDELKPLVSAYGQVTALETTNRLDLLDTAGNLRRLRDLIRDEEREGAQRTEVREFRLKHVRAGDAIETLRTLLGMKSGANQVALTQEQQQQLMEQLKAMQQKGGSPKMPKRDDEAYLAVNTRENSILAHAPVDQLAIIAKSIEYLDVPSAKDDDAALVEELPKMQRYELQAVDPTAIVRILRELGTLDPTARLEVDPENRAIIVQAPLADHVVVRAVIDKLDVGGRKMEMIQLRRANVEYVAQSLEFLLRGADSERAGTTTRRAQYATDKENNRLFLWANEAELTDVRRLLLKLGEYGETDAAPTETIPLPPGKHSDEVLKELERLWPSVSPNPLLLAPPAATPSEPEATAPVKADAVAEERRFSDGDEIWALAVADTQPTDATTAAPIRVTRGPHGLIVTGEDLGAIQRLKDLVGEITANDTNRHVFTLKNANVTEVASLLTAAYLPEPVSKTTKKAAGTDSRFRWEGFDDLQAEDTLPPGTVPPAIRFLPDPLTSTILVQGASDLQLEEIRELIESYDKVPPPESQPTRRTQIVKIKYASATELSKVVKDVFRDLLSPDDPAILANFPPDQRRMPYGYRNSSGRNNRPEYKGLLSVGVNEELNTLVISAPDDVMKQVSSLVERLDADALAEQPVAEVRRVTGIVHDRLLRAVLNNAVDPESETSVSVEMRGQSDRRDDGRRRNYGRGR